MVRQFGFQLFANRMAEFDAGGFKRGKFAPRGIRCDVFLQGQGDVYALQDKRKIGRGKVKGQIFGRGYDFVLWQKLFKVVFYFADRLSEADDF